MPVDRNRIALPRHSLLLLALLPALSAHAGNWQNNVAIGGFNSVNVYTPDTVSPVGNGRALLIVLHGCTQSITAFAGAKLEVAAETHGMVVAVPDAMHKAGFSCWNYWDATKSRSHQDYAKLISLANTLSGDAARNIDPNQVYIAGLSSGAAFASQTACLAPHVFAGVAPSAGPAIGTGSNGAFSLENVSPATFKSRCESYAGTFKPHLATQMAVVAHGTSDTTVPQGYNEISANGFANVYGVAKLSGTSTVQDAPGKTAELHRWQDGRVAMLWLNGLSHAWSGGTGASGSYVGANSINFADFIGGWFAQHNTRVSRNLPPEIAGLTATVAGNALAIGGSASDDGSVQRVAIAVHEIGGGGAVLVRTFDATLAGSGFSAGSGPLPDGLYRVTAVATDNEGAASAQAQATVRIGPPPPATAPVLADLAAVASGQCVTVSGTATDANQDLASVRVAFGAGTPVDAALDGSAFSVQQCGLPGGAHSATITATDATALAATANVAFSIDAGQSGDYNVHIAKGRITWGAGYAACYLAFGNTAFVMREVAEGGQCRWVADGAPTCAGPLQACSSGGGGNGGGNDDGGGPPSGNPGAFSAGATSGYVKANASGGSVEVGAQAGYALGTGWDGKNNRSVLAFDTSAIPDNAVIERAYLVVTRASGAGTPWAGGNTLVVDARAGCFGAACGVAVDDYASAASASGVAVVPQFSSGSATSADFDAGGRAAINLAGTTELRLRFAAHPASGSYLFLSGTTAPVLHVEYSLPAQ